MLECETNNEIEVYDDHNWYSTREAAARAANEAEKSREKEGDDSLACPQCYGNGLAGGCSVCGKIVDAGNS
jgi:hypothetical protein